MHYITSLKNKVGELKNRTQKFVSTHPVWFFFIALFILVALIVAGNIIRKPAEIAKTEKPEVHAVKTATLGKNPTLKLQGQIEKSGLVTITALSGGVVSKIHRPEGSEVQKGSWIISLSSNYQGGNLPATSRKLAQKQVEQSEKTASAQNEILDKQRELAEKGEVQAKDMRDLTRQTISETEALISLNSDILTTLDKNIANLESTNAGGANDSAILQTKQVKSQFLGATNQAKAGLRQAQYSADNEKVPAQIATVQKDVAIKQIDLQKSMLALSVDVAKLQLQLSTIQEGLMYPSSPFPGVVQRVLVKEGESVAPGTPLAIVAEDLKYDPAKVVVLVAPSVARSINANEPVLVHLSTTDIYVKPSYVSSDAVKNGLHAVYLPIPDELLSVVNDKEYVSVELSVERGAELSSSIPLDSVYQTSAGSYVYVIENGQAVTRNVELGQVYGSHVSIVKGLKSDDVVILDRSVVAGEHVSASSK